MRNFKVHWHKLNTRYFDQPMYEYKCECGLATISKHNIDKHELRREIIHAHFERCEQGSHVHTFKKFFRKYCAFCKMRIK